MSRSGVRRPNLSNCILPSNQNNSIQNTLINYNITMNRAEIIRTQNKIGVSPDGFWGPVSIAACESYLRQMMPARFPSQSNVQNFYGPHGVDGGYTPPRRRIRLPFRILCQITNRAISHLEPHERCADSLCAVFENLAQVYPTEESRRNAGILAYDGLYAPRMMRGSANNWSMHAWAIAIDLNASRNGNRTHWPTIATMPIEVMECFAKEGWTPAGAFWSRDAMHFQATSV